MIQREKETDNKDTEREENKHRTIIENMSGRIWKDERQYLMLPQCESRFLLLQKDDD